MNYENIPQHGLSHFYCWFIGYLIDFNLVLMEETDEALFTVKIRTEKNFQFTYWKLELRYPYLA